MSEWTLNTLKKYVIAKIDGNDERYKQEFDNQKLAVKDALAAQKELTNAAFNSSEKAIVKAEDSQRTYNQGHNDLSKKMEDQYKLMIPRTEHQGAIRAMDDKNQDLNKKIDALSIRLTAIESRGEGRSSLWGYIIGGIGAVAIILSFIKK